MTAQPRPGFVTWFTGLPASGKTTLARSTQQLLVERGIHAILVDSDDWRAILTPRPEYTEAERDWFYSVIGYLATWLANNSVNVLVAATANRRLYRDQARQQIERFAEVYVYCPLAVCRERDPKGIYDLAQEGKAGNVPGVGTVYEAPLAPEAVVDTSNSTPDEAAESVAGQLQRARIIRY